MGKKRKLPTQPVMRITSSRKRSVEELANLLAAIAPATTRGKGFCVKRVAEEKGVGKYWRDEGNKRKSMAAFFEKVLRKYPQKPKRIVLDIVEGGILWSASKGHAVTLEHLKAIADKMSELGFKLHREFAKLELLDPSRVTKPPLDLASNIDRLDFHNTLKDDCSEMFRNGHLNEAVRKALERFEKKIQDVVGDHSSIGKALMAKAFNAERPLIPINGLKTGTEKSEQEGFMHLTMGAMAGMRNLYSHGDAKTMTPMDAFERLCFVSLLFKRVDMALVMSANKKGVT